MIYIYPKMHLKAKTLDAFRKEKLPEDFYWRGRQHLFFENGKAAIHHIMNIMKLKRDDEVCIFTSTGENFVSTCVTGPVFNYCKVSRVVTEKTKALYIIHEFGFPHPDMMKIVALGRKKKIPVIEDCAHTFDSRLNGTLVGNFGDYAIYSITKHLPVSMGGILTGKRLSKRTEYYDVKTAEKVKQEFENYVGYLPEFSERRRNIDAGLKALFKKYGASYVKSAGDPTPYYTILKTKHYKEAYADLSPQVAELGRIYIKNWVAIPTQPLAAEEDLRLLIEKLPHYF